MPGRTLSIFENYLDQDFAYFLGLIVARGETEEDGRNRRIMIDFPLGSLQAEGVKVSYNKAKELRLAVGEIRDRLYELLGQNVQMKISNRQVQLKVHFETNNLIWRNLRQYLKGKKSFREFEIPGQIYDADVSIQKEFVRGFCDIAATVRKSNADQGGRHRVYIDVLNSNWHLPIQLCALLQKHLDVPVSNILWGHPNTREPNRPVPGGTWAREHQIRVYADAFLPIGFYVEYKNAILKELAQINKKESNYKPKPCNPHRSVKHVRRRKMKHPGEKSAGIPKEIRGKHFNAYWQICLGMGCKQATKPDPNQIEMFETESSEEE